MKITLLIAFLILLFPAIWLLVAAIFHFQSKWNKLQKRFGNNEDISGNLIDNATVFVGGVRFKNMVRIIINQSGFSLALPFPYNAFSRNIFVGFEEIETAKITRSYGQEFCDLRIKGLALEIRNLEEDEKGIAKHVPKQLLNS